jgi:D-sedoheptulose 7-phosphate isomerase
MSPDDPPDATPLAPATLTEELREVRRGPGKALAEQAGPIARAARDMAERFRRGGTLFAFGDGPCAADAQHVAVEFLHPVMVGKKPLPARCLSSDLGLPSAGAGAEELGNVFAKSLARLAGKDDIAIGISECGEPENVRRGLEAAAARGLLTVSLVGGTVSDPDAALRVDHRLRAASSDPLVVRELQLTTYHLIWETVQAFLEGPIRSQI